ncbi:hypothetical protein Q8F55_000686 [Vanrija albida]|uniref:Transcription elongation factor Eaf N-terminal domain-containing protein n=1 Tax=Vanrija albida TaxID=181172 RepID=A0ABR3QEG3_9TREE
MATDLLGSLPTGTFALELAPSARALLGKRRAPPNDDDELLALRYKFKPVSVAPETPGALDYANTGRVLAFDLPSGGHQVFDIREEASKARECALVWDEQRSTFVLHSLPTTLNLAVNRTLSPAWPEGRVPAPSLAPESPPRAKKPRAPSPRPEASAAAAAAVRKQLPNSVLPAAPAKPKRAPAKKKAAAPKASPAKPKAAPKKRGGKAAAAAAVPASKVKSEEFIEDSDDDAGDDDGMDEFANMLGEAVEQAASTKLAGYDDDDDDDDVEEDEDDELGGAHFAGYQPTAEADDVEWI